MNGADDRDLLAERMRCLIKLQRKLAHDLRGPLNVLGLQLDLLATALGDSADERPGRYLGTLRRELGALNLALDRTVALFRPWDGGNERFDGREVAQQAVALVGDSARGRAVELVIDPRVTEVPLGGNREALLHVLLVLISREADRHGGGLTLRLLTEEGQARFDLEPDDAQRAAGAASAHPVAEPALQVAQSILAAHGGQLEFGGGGGEAAVRLVLPLEGST